MADSLDYISICESCPAGDGWGPPVTTETTLEGVPYAPFSKGDKLGRMADWTAEGKDRERGSRMQYQRNYRDQQVYGSSHAVTFSAPVAEDESSFSIVSNTRDTTKTRYGRGAVFTRGRGQRGGRGDARSTRGQSTRGGGAAGRQGGSSYDSRGRGGGGGARGRRFGWKDYDKPARNRDPSINIRADWELLEEIDFNRLGKLNLDGDEGEDLSDYGFLYAYDRSYDKPPVKGMERKLTALDRAAYNVTTSSDPVIQELAERNEATIFATDSILSMLMCSTRSVFPWDIVIVRQGGKVFLDKRDGATLDMVTVNENAVDGPLDAADGNKDIINQPAALAEEATYINHNFANQVVIESQASRVDMANANPFYNSSEDTDPPASKAYRYRRFDLSTNDEEPVYLIVRTEVDAIQRNAVSGDVQRVSLKALNEFDSKAQGSGGALDWRTKLVAQRGAVVATEMKNNSCKLARWTIQSILAKSDVMKLGFVSRANPRSNDKHVILGVVGWKPRDFANQMNLSISNGWGIVRTIVDMCARRGDGRFILLKDPNKSVLRLYEVPGALEDEDEDEEGEDEEQGQGEGNDE
ncbi:translation initiation factor 3 subunit D [Geosmithia morbida]|uniref:Eukaryotic translation initiation factor 3 subunit D n=1 Tax=Geosmithia morbida TaxID=1094350 RepID=A0A9P4YT06_9HYPO|nr:translation initiation factor 3 subunit D [Geosmithia morbida]KAF4122571.1 translation initiation factor 3 subunit D [Geosmithia morbida]